MIIPGAIAVTGFIGPTDSTDVYAVTDSIYGIDGLRNVADHAERDTITAARRRQGMFVGTQNDSKYWSLNAGPWNFDDTDWTLALDLSAGPLAEIWESIGTNIQTSTSLFSPAVPNVLPAFDAQQDLGSLTKTWKDLYIDTIYLGVAGKIWDDAGTLKIGNDTGIISFPDSGNIHIPQASVGIGFGTAPDSTHKMRITLDGTVHTFASRVDLSGTSGAAMTGYNVRSTSVKTGAGTLRGVDVNITGAATGGYSYIGGRFKVSGASTNYSLELVDGTEGLNKVLTSVTAGGLANWVDVNTLITVAPTKYTEEFIPGTVGVANTITHGLGTEDLLVQLWHNKKLINADTVEVIDVNTIEVTFVGVNPAELSPALVKITVIGL